MFLLFVFVFSFFFSALVYAVGAESEVGQVTEIISPLINFAIFIGILYWALKKRFRDYFSNYRGRIATLYEQTQIKKKKAERAMNECQEKMRSVSKETSQILTQAEKDASVFGREYQNEVKNKIEKFSVDSRARLKTEGVSLLDQLKRELLDSVLSKAKSSLDGDASLKSKITANLTRDLP